jgi:hypothetical protein
MSAALRLAVPSDRPHILTWDCADAISIRSLCNTQHADYVNYRDDLILRTSAADRFLVLDRYIDREVEHFRELCRRSTSGVVVLHELDVLIAYLESRPGHSVNILWDRLLNLRHLEAFLWIVLPSSCVSSRWPHDRREPFCSTASMGTN